MSNKQIHRIKTISEFHRFRGLSKPEHPLISLIDYSKINHSPDSNQISWVQSFYTVGLKRNVNGKFRYGQQEYDFDEGLMSFIAPGQIYSITVEDNDSVLKPSGWLLLVHPDFLWNTPLAKNIQQYGFLVTRSMSLCFFLKRKKSLLQTF